MRRDVVSYQKTAIKRTVALSGVERLAYRTTYRKPQRTPFEKFPVTHFFRYRERLSFASFDLSWSGWGREASWRPKPLRPTTTKSTSLHLA